MQPTRPAEPLRVIEVPARSRRNRSTVGWTRHTLGSIEAGRDNRREGRVPGPIRYRTAPNSAAVVLRPDFARDRWVGEGGSFERDVAAAVAALPR